MRIGRFIGTGAAAASLIAAVNLFFMGMFYRLFTGHIPHTFGEWRESLYLLIGTRDVNGYAAAALLIFVLAWLAFYKLASVED